MTTRRRRARRERAPAPPPDRSKVRSEVRLKVHGLLLLDKPVGLSSNAALQRSRRLLDADKAGHGGTLDPLAGGLLPVMFGEACKLALASLEGDKGYRARVRLGERTTTDDAEGEIIERRSAAAVLADPAAIEAALDGFRGPIEQVPPQFSALKRDGKPMYERARAGEVIALAARPVVIHELVLEGIEDDDLVVSLRCSKGTYVRSLARDLGQRLGCGAHLAALQRTRVGRFTVDAAIGLADLEALPAEARSGRLIGLEALVADWPAVGLDERATAAFRQGQAVRLAAHDAGLQAGANPSVDGPVAVFCAGRLIGLGRWTVPPDDARDQVGLLAPARVMV